MVFRNVGGTRKIKTGKGTNSSVAMKHGNESIWNQEPKKGKLNPNDHQKTQVMTKYET